MIYSTGIDIIEIDRIKKAMLSDAFLHKVYTNKEIELFSKKPNSLAGNFAAKEAVVKAFGVGFQDISPNEIEILRDNFGKPIVNLYSNALDFYLNHNFKAIHISISHNRTSAIASATVEV